MSGNDPRQTRVEHARPFSRSSMGRQQLIGAVSSSGASGRGGAAGARPYDIGQHQHLGAQQPSSTYPPYPFPHQAAATLPQYHSAATELSSTVYGTGNAPPIQGFTPTGGIPSTELSPTYATSMLPYGSDQNSAHPNATVQASLQGAGSAAGGRQPTKTRVRPIVSCVQCRARRSKCNRVYPCSECEKRGDGLACSFEGSSISPLPASGRRHESNADLQAYAASLEDKIRQLQRLLSAKESSGEASSGNNSSSEGGSARAWQAQAGHSQSTGSSPHDSPHRDYLAVAGSGPGTLVASEDLVGQLTEVVVGIWRRNERLQAHPLLEKLVSSVERGTASASNEGSGDFMEAAAGRVRSTSDLTRLLPNEGQARACLAVFKTWINCWHAIIDLDTFSSRAAAFWASFRHASATPPSFENADLRWLAVYFGVCGLGASLMRDSAATEAGLPGRPARGSLALSWRMASFRCLALSGVFSDPDFDTLRALCLLLYHRAPENVESVFWIFSSAVAIASRLGVWREPSSSLSAGERDARRSLAWCLADCDWIGGYVYGKGWHLLDDEFCEMALPGDPAGTDFRIPPSLHQYPNEPMMENFRIRCALSRIGCRLSRETHSAADTNYNNFQQVEQDLETVESQMPAELHDVLAGTNAHPWRSTSMELMISGLGTVLRLCYLRIRLHQPFAAPRPAGRAWPAPVDVRHHLAQIVRYSRTLLSIQRSAVFDFSWTEPLLIVVNGAIALAMVLATAVPNANDSSTLRTALRDLTVSLRAHAGSSSVIRRSVQIIERLLDQRGALVAPPYVSPRGGQYGPYPSVPASQDIGPSFGGRAPRRGSGSGGYSSTSSSSGSSAPIHPSTLGLYGVSSMADKSSDYLTDEPSNYMPLTSRPASAMVGDPSAWSYPTDEPFGGWPTSHEGQTPTGSRQGFLDDAYQSSRRH